MSQNLKSQRNQSLTQKKSKIPIVKNTTKIYRVKEKNIVLLSKGKLEKKINGITGNVKTKPPSKRNRNGKQGIDKSNNCAYIQNAPRKTCFNCGNTNHLDFDCRKVKKNANEVSSLDIRSRLVNYKPQNHCLIVAVNGILFFCVMNITACIMKIMNHCQSFIKKHILIRL